jgi:uroporphyrinogen decarboxylase
MMTSRERVLCALAHEEPDRVPIFFGASGATTIHVQAYERLKSFLGIVSDTKLMSKAMQFAFVEPTVMERVGADAWPVVAGPAPSIHRQELAGGNFIDEWGVRWELEPRGMYYSPSYVNMPLAAAKLDDIATYVWPDVTNRDRFAGLKEQARHLREHTPYALVGNIGTVLNELIYNMRGLENWMMDLAADQDLAHALLRQVTNLMVAAAEAFLAAVGEYLDVFIIADDIGSQNSPLMSPGLYRRMVKPYHAEIIAAVKARTRAKVFYHSCGNIRPLIGDLVDIGVDILNPIQVSASEMGDTARLKREFGERLSFCGAIDTQQVLPSGSPQEVRAEVRRRISDLGPGGGYICAAVHSIQPDVAPENIVAMFEETRAFGRYPLAQRTGAKIRAAST